jgi:hypothetical protein
MEILGWVCALVAIAGTWLNIQQSKYGFICWLISNSTFVFVNLYLKNYSQAFLFFVYTIFAIVGYIKWNKSQ